MLCMIVVVPLLQGWPVGRQMLFAFAVPVILVWRQEKRRSRKLAPKAQAEGHSETRPSRAEPVARASASGKRIARENDLTRAARERTPRTARGNKTIKMLARFEANKKRYSYPPPQNVDADIGRAGKSVAPALPWPNLQPPYTASSSVPASPRRSSCS
jgi:Uncharacterized protein conserved in bacteria